MAAPGKREDRNATTTPLSKGKKYIPKKHRGGDRRNAGARKRSNLSKGGDSTGRNTRRNVFAGSAEMFSAASGIFESYEASYEQEAGLEETRLEKAKKRYKLEEAKLLQREDVLVDLTADLEKAISSGGFKNASRITESQDEENSTQ